MKRFEIIVVAVLIVLCAETSVIARPILQPQLKQVGDADVATPPHDTAKASRDTIYLIGAPGAFDGRFEISAGDPHWHGWTVDGAEPPQRWSASTYNAENLGAPGNHAAWCGADFPPCDEEDPAGGYGNNWDEALDYWGTAPDADLPTSVTIKLDANFDTEQDFDFIEFQYETGEDQYYETVFSQTGDLQGLFDLAIEFVVSPQDYLGGDSDQIHLRWRVTTDGGWSDEDCEYASNGACQIDNVQVLFDGNEVIYDDFEDGPYPANVVGNWTVAYPAAPIVYAALGRDLPEDDPDQDNPSWQVNWLSYPGDDFDFGELLASPPLLLPETFDQLVYASDVCLNEDPGHYQLYFAFWLRSTIEDDPAALAMAEWQGEDFWHYGAPGYQRFEEEMAEYVVPGAKWLQVSFQVRDFGWTWGWPPATGAGAPYFDNVAVMVAGEVTATLEPVVGQLQAAAFPNPFNPVVRIEYAMPHSGELEISIFDLRGQRVRTLIDQHVSAGTGDAIWQGNDATGRQLGSGTYFCRVSGGGEERLIKLMLIK